MIATFAPPGWTLPTLRWRGSDARHRAPSFLTAPHPLDWGAWYTLEVYTVRFTSGLLLCSRLLSPFERPRERRDRVTASQRSRALHKAGVTAVKPAKAGVCGTWRSALFVCAMFSSALSPASTEFPTTRVSIFSHLQHVSICVCLHRCMFIYCICLRHRGKNDSLLYSNREY